MAFGGRGRGFGGKGHFFFSFPWSLTSSTGSIPHPRHFNSWNSSLSDEETSLLFFYGGGSEDVKDLLNVFRAQYPSPRFEHSSRHSKSSLSSTH